MTKASEFQSFSEKVRRQRRIGKKRKRRLTLLLLLSITCTSSVMFRLKGKPMSEMLKDETVAMKRAMQTYFHEQFELQKAIIAQLQVIKKSQNLLTSIFVDARKNYEDEG